MFDTLIEHGRVLTGDNVTPVLADIGIVGGRIVAVDLLGSADAVRRIDAGGQLVLPGFIDSHVHGDLWLLDNDAAPALAQGVTTFVLGQDGTSTAPVTVATQDFFRRYFRPVNGDPAVSHDWYSVGEYLQRIDAAAAVNVAYLVPNGNVRAQVMGLTDRSPSTADLQMMADLVRRGLDEGAVGLSTGLDYIPSRHAGTEELIALSKPLAERGGVYVSHMRHSLGRPDLWVAEVEQIAASAGIAGHISHFAGDSKVNLQLLQRAHNRGVDLSFDHYPYLAGSTLVAMTVLPPWVQSGGLEVTRGRLADPAVRRKLFEDWDRSGEPPFNRMPLCYVDSGDYEWAIGLTLDQAAETAGTAVRDFVCDLLVETSLGAGSLVWADHAEEDLSELLRSPHHLGCSDGIYYGQRPHPRGWGAFARFLARHVRELSDWTLADAVQHLASGPAARFGLADRGRLARGFAADVVVLDPATVADSSTYADPKCLAAGVSFVLVNGTVAIDGGRPTGARAGMALRRRPSPP